MGWIAGKLTGVSFFLGLWFRGSWIGWHVWQLVSILNLVLESFWRNIDCVCRCFLANFELDEAFRTKSVESGQNA